MHLIAVRRLMLALLLACGQAVASSWSVHGDGPQRSDADVVDALAAWRIDGDRLARLPHAGGDSASAPIGASAPQPALLASDSAAGVWLGRGNVVLHYDAALQVTGSATLWAPVRALVAAGPDALWVATRDEVARIDRRLRVSEQRALGLAGDEIRGVALDPAAGALWVMAHRQAVRIDVFEGLREITRVAVPDAAAVALDDGAGELWVVTERRMQVFDRRGDMIIDLPVADGALSGPKSLLVDSAAGRIHAGDARGIAALSLATGQWTRVVEDPGASLVRSARSTAPAVDIAGEAASQELRVHVHAACVPVRCAPDDRYATYARLRATIDGVDVSPRLRRIDGGVSVLPLESVQARDDAAIRIDVVDAYGNAASPVHTDLRALRAQSRVKANQPPVVAITAPVNNTVAVAPASFTITASASDADGTVTKVEFYRSGVLLGTDAAAPYSWTWSNVAVGTYSLTAKAYDNAGAITMSAPVSVQVRANVPPTVTLTSPPNNSNFVAPATITLSATAADSDGSVSKVDFLRGGATLIGSVTSPPYTYTWSNVAAGTYSLTAKATDSKGASTTSAAMTARVNNPPNVAITAPASNASFVAPATVTIQASASDTDGTVAKVEFFQNGTLLGTDTATPYSYAWANPPLGNYSLTAKATDNLGATRVSSPVAISVKANQPPAVTLTAPSGNLQRVAGTSLALAATASDSDGSIARVEFRLGGVLMGTDTTAPYTGTLTVPQGSFALVAVATDNKGAQATSLPVTLTGLANQLPDVSLDVPLDGQSFPAATPPDITLRASASDADGTITRVRFMVITHLTDGTQGAPVVIGTATQPPYGVVWQAVPFTVDPLYSTLPEPESYEVWAEADDDAGGTGFPSRNVMITVPNGSPWSIAVTTPANGAELLAPATVVLVATPAASNPNGIQQVEFVADGSSLASLTAPNGVRGEFVHAWRNAAPGTHSIVARLTDAAGFVVQSDASVVSVRPPDQLPTVTLTAPATLVDSVGPAGLAVSLTATAGDTDGRVVAVDYVADGLVVASVAAPFTASWSNAAPGIHAVRARARDDRGREAQSPPVFVNVRVSERAPVVAMTAPAPGGTYRSGAPVTLQADAIAPDGVVSRVDFVYVPNNVVIGSATSAPYRCTWIPPAGNGTYTLRANVTTVARSSAASTPVTVNVSSNGPPVVTLTSPRDGQTLTGPIALSATASDADGTIAKIEFLANGVAVATVTTTPYNASWTPPAPRTYAIAARATDNGGATATSSVATITILAAVPSIAITSPATNAVALAGQPLTIIAQGTLPGHTLARIEFLVDGALTGSVAITGAVSASAASYTWATPAAGAHTLSARVAATDGTSLVSAGVAVQISDFAVTLAEPLAGQVFLAPGDIRIFAAPSSSGSGIARVDFLGDGVLLGSATAPPYLFVWHGMGAGTHTVSVRAVDSTGLAVGASASVRVVASPSLAVDGGIDGSSIADDAGSVTGTVVAPRNASLIVNGQLASLDPQGRFFLENLLLQPGINKLVLWLNSHDAPPVSQTITINSTSAAPFAVDLSPQQGFAPLAATLSIRNRTATTYQRMEIDSNDDGTPEQTFVSVAGGEQRIAYTFPAPGLYRIRVTVYDASNRIAYQARRQARVYDRAELAGKVIDTYWSMLDRLAANDSAAALRLFTADAQDRYADVFATLGNGIVTVAPQLRRIVDGVVGEDIAELTHARDTPDGPQVFMIYLVRGRDGLWRIETM